MSVKSKVRNATRALVKAVTPEPDDVVHSNERLPKAGANPPTAA